MELGEFYASEAIAQAQTITEMVRRELPDQRVYRSWSEAGRNTIRLLRGILKE
jgi:hypothetical protein